MKKATIFNGIEFLTKKEIVQGVSSEKRLVSSELANFAHSVDYAFKQLTATGSESRDSANLVKSVYKTALEVVANCYPYQAAAPGKSSRKIRNGVETFSYERGALLVKEGGVWKIKQQRGRAAAGYVVRVSVQNYIAYRGRRRDELVTYIDPSEIAK